METQNLSRLINEKLERAEGIAERTDSDEIKRRLKLLRDSQEAGRERKAVNST